jgi:hypothetical protein
VGRRRRWRGRVEAVVTDILILKQLQLEFLSSQMDLTGAGAFLSRPQVEVLRNEAVWSALFGASQFSESRHGSFHLGDRYFRWVLIGNALHG